MIPQAVMVTLAHFSLSIPPPFTFLTSTLCHIFSLNNTYVFLRGGLMQLNLCNIIKTFSQCVCAVSVPAVFPWLQTRAKMVFIWGFFNISHKQTCKHTNQQTQNYTNKQANKTIPQFSLINLRGELRFLPASSSTPSILETLQNSLFCVWL